MWSLIKFLYLNRKIIVSLIDNNCVRYDIDSQNLKIVLLSEDVEKLEKRMDILYDFFADKIEEIENSKDIIVKIGKIKNGK